MRLVCGCALGLNYCMCVFVLCGACVWHCVLCLHYWMWVVVDEGSCILCMCELCYVRIVLH